MSNIKFSNSSDTNENNDNKGWYVKNMIEKVKQVSQA